jgi:hypothetical protein
MKRLGHRASVLRDASTITLRRVEGGLAELLIRLLRSPLERIRSV